MLIVIDLCLGFFFCFENVFYENYIFLYKEDYNLKYKLRKSIYRENSNF